MSTTLRGYVLMLLIKWVDGARITCGLNQYTFKVANNEKYCADCARCPKGMGTVPQCGAFLHYATKIECRACVLGRSYSPSHGFTSCESCTVCVDNETLIKKCTPTSNTVCGTCKPSYYRTFVHSCEKCSPCCEGAGEEDIEVQCLKQGIAKTKACKYTGRKCQEETQEVTATDKPQVMNNGHEDGYVTITKWQMYLVGMIVIILLLLVILLFAIRFHGIRKIYGRHKPTQKDTSWRGVDECKQVFLPKDLEQNDALDGKSNCI